MKALVVVLALAQAATSQCNTRGCRRCGPNNSCEVCNNQLDYAPNAKGDCVLVSLSQCSLVDDSSRCVVCNKGYLPANGVCKASLVPNCVLLDSNSVCVRCGPGLVLRKGQCASTSGMTAIPNCSSYVHNADRPTQPDCTICNVGYRLVNHGCVAQPANCVKPNDLRCDKCVPNAFLVPDFNYRSNFNNYNNFYNNLIASVNDHPPFCAANTDVNCKTAISASECGACLPGFYPKNKVCVAVTNPISNCVAYFSATICAICADGFSFSNGACVTNPAEIAGCLYYSSPTLCARCAKDYFPDQGKCSPVDNATAVENCRVYSAAGVCEFCIYTDMLVNNTCQHVVQGISSCAQVVATAAGIAYCVLCAPGFFLLNGNCQPTSSELENCAVYFTATACAECRPDYYLAAGKCVAAAVPNCRVFSAPGVCAHCAPGFFLDGEACSTVNFSSAGCLISASASACAVCQTGHVLNDSKICVPLPAEGCAVFSSDTGCESCASGFYYDANTNSCRPITVVQGCATSYYNIVCLSCAGDFYLSDGECLPVFSAIPQCVRYFSSVNCERCSAPYYADGDHCVESIAKVPNCAGYSGEGRCSECESTHFLDSSGACALRVFHPIADCASYSSPAACGRCLPHFFLSANACTKVATVVPDCFEYASPTQCRYCDWGFVLQNGSCVAYGPVANCLVHSAAGVCAKCENQTFLAGNRCAPVPADQQIPGCRVYNSLGPAVCVRCEDLHYLMGDRCVPFSGSLEGCLFRLNSFACAVCRPGFYVDGGLCSRVAVPVENCAQYLDSQTCVFCAAGFYLSANRCTSVGMAIAHCRTYSAPTVCAVCQFPFYVSANQCLPVPNLVDGCLYYSGPTVCAQCQDGWAMSYSANSSMCHRDCLVADTNSCAVCAPLFYLAGSACQRVSVTVTHCLLYIADGICSQCEPSYYLDSNACQLASGQDGCAALYASSSECALCTEGFVWRDGACAPVPTGSQLANCGAYSLTMFNNAENYNCEVCKSDSYQTGYRGECVKLSCLKNCPSPISAARLVVFFLLVLLFF